jgi:BMFP domain-containing protein YqiC
MMLIRNRNRVTVDKSIIDKLARRLADAVPEGVREGAPGEMAGKLGENIGGLQQDIEENFRGLLQATLGKLDLVTREEFDVQSKVLARTRQKLEQLQAELDEMRDGQGGKDQGGKDQSGEDQSSSE